MQNLQAQEMDAQIHTLIKSLTIKDLRIQLRARGESPAGGQETLVNRLTQLMATTGDLSIKGEDGSDVVMNDQAAGSKAVASKFNPAHTTESNFGRPGTNTSTATTYNGRERKTPGGNSQIRFG